MGGQANRAPINEGVNFLAKFDPAFLRSKRAEFEIGLGREFEVGTLGGAEDERPPEQARASLLLKAQFMTQALDRAYVVADTRVAKLRRRIKMVHGFRFFLDLATVLTSGAVLALLRLGDQVAAYVSAWGACGAATASVLARFLEGLPGLNHESVYAIYKNVWIVASKLKEISKEISFATTNEMDNDGISALIARANSEIAGANVAFAEFL